MRVVSLLPAATEIVAALGMLDQLVGVSHECDYPLEAQAKPRVTRCAIHGGALASEEADRWVSATLAAAGTLYSMDEALIRRLQPDVIITQRLCDVCAVGYESVTAFAATLPGPPHVINLDPSSVPDVLQDIRTVGAALAVSPVSRCSPRSCTPSCSRAASPRAPSVASRRTSSPRAERSVHRIGAARRLRPIGRGMRQRLVGRVEPEPAAEGERHSLVGGAAHHVRLVGTHEGEERAQPAVGHVEHDLARLDARRGELLEHEVGEGAHVLLAPGVGELPRAHRIERHHEPLAALAPKLGAASPAAVAHPDAHELETLHTARIAPRPAAVNR